MDLVNSGNRRVVPQEGSPLTTPSITLPTLISDVLTQHEEEEAVRDAASHEHRYRYDDAVAIYISLAEKGSEKALIECLKLLAEKLGLDMIFNACLNADKQGSSIASFLLGRMYKAGDVAHSSAEESSVSAIEYYQKAYESCMKADKQGSSIASFLLGCIYEAGGIAHISAEASSIKAIEYYQKAYEKGFLDAGHKLVRMCINSNNKNNIDKAVSTIRSLAEKGQPYCCDIAGLTDNEVLKLFDSMPRGDADNTVKMMMTLLHMVEEGSIKALGEWRSKLNCGSIQNEAVVILFNYLTKEHEIAEGSPAASLILGMMYDEGTRQDIGVAKNNSKRLECYEKADEGGSKFAAGKIGNIYDYEKKDLVTACKYYQKGADQEDILSMIDLAPMYEYGKGGLEKNYLKACQYYKEGAKYHRNDQFVVSLISRCIHERELNFDLVESALNFLTQPIRHLSLKITNISSGIFNYYLSLDEPGAEVELQRFLSLMCQILGNPKTDAAFADVIVAYLNKIDAKEMSYIPGSYDYKRVEAKYSSALIYYRMAAEKGNEAAKNSILDLFLKDRAVNDDLEFTKHFLQEVASGQTINAERARDKLDEINHNVDKRSREEKEPNESVKKARHF